MATKTKGKKSEQGNGLKPFPEACQKFANLVINKPFVYNGNGKMRSKQGCLLEKDLKEEGIEVLIGRM